MALVTLVVYVEAKKIIKFKQITRCTVSDTMIYNVYIKWIQCMGESQQRAAGRRLAMFPRLLLLFCWGRTTWVIEFVWLMKSATSISFSNHIRAYLPWVYPGPHWCKHFEAFKGVTYVLGPAAALHMQHPNHPPEKYPSDVANNKKPTVVCFFQSWRQ